MTWEDLSKSLAAPARRALASAGIHSLEDLAQVPRRQIAHFHGVGPRALLVIEEALGGAARDDSVERYLKQFEGPVRDKLVQLRACLRELLPDAKERISYRIPAYWWHEDVVYFAGFRAHVSLFPTSSGVRAFEAELASYTTSRGTIQFPLDRPLPLDLITRIVQFRWDEVRTKHSAVTGRPS